MDRNDYNRIVSRLTAPQELKPRIREKIVSAGIGRGKKRKFKKPIIAACAAFTLLLTGFTGLYIRTVRNGSDSQCLALTVYAADNASDVLTSDFKKDSRPTLLKPDIIVNMPEYSPLTSSVPGIPFKVDIKNVKNSKGIKVKLTVCGGNIVTWDSPCGSTHIKGKNYVCGLGETVYWSPLNGGAVAKGKTVITAAELNEGRTIARQRIIVETADGTHYTAELEKK